MGTKPLFITAFSLLAVAALGFAVAFFSASVRDREDAASGAVFPVPESRRVMAGTTRTPAEQVRASEPPASRQETGVLQAPVLPEFVPKIKETIERIVESGVAALPPPATPLPSFSNAADIPSGILLAPPSPGVPQPLTEQEIFDLLYPDFYRGALQSAQESLVSEGVIAPAETVPLRTEEEIKVVSEKILRYLYDQGFVDAEAYQTSLRGAGQVFSASYDFKLREAQTIKAIREGKLPNSPLTVTPEEALAEFKEILRSQGYDFDAILRGQPSSRAPSEGRLVLSRHLIGVITLLGKFFTASVANAFCGPTYCISPPICFMEGAPTPGGFNFPTPCCFGRICGVPIGCFELCGNGAKPFIWDFGICGCG